MAKISFNIGGKNHLGIEGLVMKEERGNGGIKSNAIQQSEPEREGGSRTEGDLEGGGGGQVFDSERFDMVASGDTI